MFLPQIFQICGWIKLLPKQTVLEAVYEMKFFNFLTKKTALKNKKWTLFHTKTIFFK